VKPRKSDLAVKPIARSKTIPSSWYTDPDFFRFEMESVLSRSWQYLGDARALDAPGSFLSGEAAGHPVFAVRGNDGDLRTFHNVCRHRGGPVVTADQGTCKALQCGYHGWTYTLEGMLRGVPRFNRVELFDKKDFGLVPVDHVVWEKMLFVRLGRGAFSLTDAIGPVASRVTPGSLGAYRFHTRVVYEASCNWKVYVDNYLEGYHIPYVHPELNTILDYGDYVTETFPWLSLQRSAFSAGNIYSADGSGDALYYFLFPNFMLNILPGRLQTNLVVPLAHNRTSIVFDYYYDAAIPDPAKKAAEDMGYSDIVQKEDIEICERVQKGLESPAYDTGRFSVEMEQGVYHFQSLLKKTYARGLTS
jgi:choline monooxygenase